MVDSMMYTGVNSNNKEFIEVPYAIGTIVELKNNPNILAKISQYRINLEDSVQVINVGLSNNAYENESQMDFEITLEELEENWKKTDRMIIIEKLDADSFVGNFEFSNYFNKSKKLKL